jgi:hypothetical protein
MTLIKCFLTYSKGLEFGKVSVEKAKEKSE